MVETDPQDWPWVPAGLKCICETRSRAKIRDRHIQTSHNCVG